MTDYDTDNERDQNPDDPIWVHLWSEGHDMRLPRFILGVSIAAIALYLLVQLLGGAP